MLQPIPDKHVTYLVLCTMASYKETRISSKLSVKEKELQKKRERTLREQGWLPLDTSEQCKITGDGYFGVAYYKINDATNTVEIVIAHRGTCFDELGNVLADIEIAQQKTPAILQQAKNYLATLFGGSDFYSSHAVKKFILVLSGRKIQIEKITHIGFSLGGFIAGACMVLSNVDYMEAVTFDAPGISSLDFNPTGKDDRIVNYVTAPNIVNTCNKHFGPIKQIDSFQCDKKNKEVHLKIEKIHDLGFATEPLGSSSEKTSKKEGGDQIDLVPKVASSAEILSATRELSDTLSSHDLERVILSAQLFRPIYRWPTAENKFLYGNKPDITLGSIPFRTQNRFFDYAIQLTGAIVQGIKGGAALMLWELTKRPGIDGKDEGIIGVEHFHKNQIFYTEKQYTEYELETIKHGASESTYPTMSAPLN